MKRHITTSGGTVKLVSREADLFAAIDKMLPEFARACRAHDVPIVVMHQDAFAADYQEDEYRLIGMAVEFADICGKEIHIHGRNRETVNQDKTIHGGSSCCALGAHSDCRAAFHTRCLNYTIPGAKRCRDFCRDTPSKWWVFLGSPYTPPRRVACCNDIKTSKIGQYRALPSKAGF